MEKKKKTDMYCLNDDICFRKCSLADNIIHLENEDCTEFTTEGTGKNKHYSCKNYGIHLHCTKHPEYELKLKQQDIFGGYYLTCVKCENEINIDTLDETLKDCLRLLNAPKFKNAKLIRLNDWYVPELKSEIKDEKISDYWIKTDIKVDKDGDTMIVLYIGLKNTKEKVQFFIKPEKLQLSTDHKDLDPSTILSKIEVTLKNRKIKQEYD